MTTLGRAKNVVRGATVKFDGHRVRTDRRGRAQLVLRLRRAGHLRAVVTKAGMQRDTAVVLVTHRSRRAR